MTMRRIIRPAVAVFCFIVSGVALGQKAETILDRVEDTYTNLQTFDFHGTIQATVTIDGVQHHVSSTVEVAQGNTPAEGLRENFRLPSWTTADGAAENAPAISFILPLV